MGFFALACCAWPATAQKDVHIHREFADLAGWRGCGRPPQHPGGVASVERQRAVAMGPVLVALERDRAEAAVKLAVLAPWYAQPLPKFRPSNSENRLHSSYSRGIR